MIINQLTLFWTKLFRAKLFVVACLFLFSLVSLSQAGIEVRNFSNSAQERRYHQLVDEIRCLVCQNQNLADSNSQLAQDLRNKIYDKVKANQTNQQVIDYMVERYGQFVLYNPPFDLVTSFIWIGPFILVIAAIILLVITIVSRSKATPVELSEADHTRYRKLLDNEDKNT